MHPILFEIGGFPVYTYGVLLAAAYLLGLQFALIRARARGLDANRVMDLGIWIIISALIGAKLLLLVVDIDAFRQNPRELLTLDSLCSFWLHRLIIIRLVGEAPQKVADDVRLAERLAGEALSLAHLSAAKVVELVFADDLDVPAVDHDVVLGIESRLRARVLQQQQREQPHDLRLALKQAQ